MKDYTQDTLCVQAGWHPATGESRIPSICQSTTFFYGDSRAMADCFDLKSEGYFYSRLANPTVAAFEGKVAALDGGAAAVACASGMSALTMAALTVAGAGDNILCSQSVYGGTFNLFGTTLPKLGIECRFFDPDDSAEHISALADEHTKFIFAETIANPSMVVLDFAKIAAVAKEHGLLFIADNTLATPVLCRPREFGADITVYSTSKYLEGHAAALGGMIVDEGTFTFKGNARYPSFNTPDESYHGLVYADLNVPFATKCRAQLIRDAGAIMAPMNAYLSFLGCDTLALRMARHSENAKKIAAYLAAHPKVAWVKHPSLPDNKYRALAEKYLPKGQGGMLSFGINGGIERCRAFMESLELITQETHVADVRSSVLHPASTTHRQLSEHELEMAGVPANLIRLSVGIEDADDIVADLENALKRV